MGRIRLGMVGVTFGLDDIMENSSSSVGAPAAPQWMFGIEVSADDEVRPERPEF